MIKKAMIFLIKIYQYLHLPFYRGSCKFIPSCSNYTIESLNKHGVIKGTYYSITRILRCNPFSKGGYDPVK